MMKKFTFLIAFIVMVLAGTAQTVVTITDDDLNNDTHWTSDNVYMLDGFVFLEQGTLTIEAGTVIKGLKNPTTGDNASALIITKNAKINAVGTADMPIIFTAEADDVDDPTDLDETDRGEWGGVILLGDATLGFNTETSQIEGIPTDEPRANFGGTNDTHNAGVMKYVSIRHGGAQLEPDKEINGLTMGGVGSETVIEHVEVYANDDDGFEWFGGTVSAKWLVSAFNKDDAFDYDYGWRGNGQFWFAVMAEDLSDNAGEHDGAKDDDRTPFSKPTIYNATYIGSGVGNTTAKNSTALHFRDNAGGMYANSIFTDFAKHAIEVEDLAEGIDSRLNMENGDLVIKNNIWFGFGAGSELNAGGNGIVRATENAEDANAQFLVDHLGNNGNSLEDPMLRGISRTTDGGLDPLPKAGSPVYNNLADRPDDNWFLDASYKGAFSSKNWAKEWTAVDANGYFGDVTNEVIIKDEDLSGDATWTNDNVYLLDGFVFLEQGTLTIEAGTVIKGLKNPTTGDNASALIITKNAKINAVGTADMPIIFTAEADDVDDPTDLDETDRGEWGGVILLGDATLGFNTETSQIEGIPTDEPRANFGGTNDSHNAGVMKYVSIRHGGAQLEPDKEINGLTMGGVGSETVIEHVEVFANDDDGFEWFGGTVSCKWLVSAFNKDDAFDYDYGWRGNGQFWFAVQAEDLSDNAGEHDGAKDDDRTPFSKPTIYNATYIGSGVGNTTAKNSTALHFRDNAGGMYANSIFTDFAKHAIEVEDLAEGIDSRLNMENDDLVIKNNIWFGFGAGSELNAGANGIIRATESAEDANAQFLIDHLGDNSNSIENPMLRGISRTTDGGLDPRTKIGSPVYSNLASYPETEWFTEVPYKGAFDGTNWATNWTAVDANGYFGDLDAGTASNEVIIKDEDLSDDATWTNDNVYLLDGFVFLEQGTLTIEAGTVIKGLKNPTTGDNASALIITKNAKINAVGTADMPIIFTAEADDVDDPTDLDETDRGEWGGVILLGDATLGFNTETSQIEGIPTDEPRANFGGTNDTHNAGVMKYVSIRHGGAQLEPDKEINGLTMGGVGSETVIEHVEVYANDDDGFEWFGGTVSCKWLVSAFNKDDAFDYDYGWRGNGQFWFAVMAEDLSDNAGEHDGAKDDDRTPFSKPTIYNATYIGSGVGNTTAKNSTALHFRDNAGGMYANSIFTDFAKHAIEVEDLAEGIDSRLNMENGDLVIKNNIWFGFGAGSELNAGDNGIIRATENAEDPDAQFLVNHLGNNSNSIQDPVLRGISRTTNNELDPRPHSHSPAFTVARATAPSNWFLTTNYIGAFGETNWAKHWTATDVNGYFGDFTTDAKEIGFETSVVKVYPNPTSGNATIALQLDALSTIDIRLFDITGKLVKVVAKNQVLSGNQNISVSNLKNGMYLVKTVIDGTVNTEKLIVR